MNAEQFRNEAAKNFKAAADSFERCDTDGFLSQWANGLTGNLNLRKAEIAENGGNAEFWGLFDLQGNRVAAKLIDGKFGPCWAICDSADKFTGRFIPFCAAAGEISMWDCARFTDDNGELIPEDSAEHAKRLAKAIGKIEKRIKSWEAKHGFSQRREMAPAIAYIAGRGTGLSGSAWVATKRADKGYPSGAKIV